MEKRFSMEVNGFDFEIEGNGELVLNHEDGTFSSVKENRLKCQLAYTRMVSCVNDWFYDEVGANLEELVGRHIIQSTIDVGKQRIEEVLTYDGLWDMNNIFVQHEVKNYTCLIYTVYLRLRTDEPEKQKSVSFSVILDLVKGVKVRYGWKADNKYLIGGTL